MKTISVKGEHFDVPESKEEDKLTADQLDILVTSNVDAELPAYTLAKVADARLVKAKPAPKKEESKK